MDFVERMIEKSGIERRESRTLRILGTVLFISSILLFPPLVVAAMKGENIFAFLVPMAIGFVVSIVLILRYKNPRDMRPVDGLVMIMVLWAALFIIGMIPYLVNGYSFVDSLFESVSGFVTCGATVISNVDTCAKSILLWRAITAWIGGMIIVIMFMFILPMVVSGGRSLLKNEMSGSSSGNMYMKLSVAAKQFIIVYGILTLAFFVILLPLLGGRVLDAITLAMGTISTGGFTSSSDCLDSVAVKIVLMVFMLISATNFYLHFSALIKRDFSGYKKSEEFRTMLIWFFAMAMLIIIELTIQQKWNNINGDIAHNIVDVFFTVISLGTTTGYVALDYIQEWTIAGTTLLVLLMFIGGSSGSTAGGIKISRAIVLVKAMRNEIRQQVHPNAVYGVRYEHEGISEGTVRAVMVTVIMFFLTLVISILLFDLELDWDESIYVSSALISGTGIGFRELFAGYIGLSPGLKFFACFLMILGRMEIIALLALFTRSFWVEYLGPGEIAKMKDNAKHFASSVGGVFSRKKKTPVPEGEEADQESAEGDAETDAVAEEEES